MLEKKTMKKIEKQTTPKCSKATAIAPFRSMRCVRATVIFIGQRLVWPAGIWPFISQSNGCRVKWSYSTNTYSSWDGSHGPSGPYKLVSIRSLKTHYIHEPMTTHAPHMPRHMRAHRFLRLSTFHPVYFPMGLFCCCSLALTFWLLLLGERDGKWK